METHDQMRFSRAQKKTVDGKNYCTRARGIGYGVEDHDGGMPRVLSHALREIDRAILGDVYTSREPQKNLIDLCAMGNGRFPGTDGEKAAADYLVHKVREYAVSSVVREPVSYLGWRRGSASLILPGCHKEIDCISLAHVGSHDITGQGIFLGAGTVGEFEAYADSIKDRVLVCTTRSPSYVGRDLHRREKILRAFHLGAKAIVFISSTGGFLEETGSTVRNRECPIPAVSVSQEAGFHLRQILQDESPLIRIVTENQFANATCHNIVGGLGDQEAGDIIIAGAHYDAHDIGQGAMDNASGTVILLEAARLLGKHARGLNRPLRFIFFAAEDIQCVGSFGYMERHAQEADRIKFVVNIDGIKEPDPGIALQGWPELIPFSAELQLIWSSP